jgi:hypothetical protein
MKKNGSKHGMAFGLYPMTYHIFVHDPAFFLHNYRPKTFPGFSLKTDPTNKGVAVYISVTEHLDLNTKSNACNEDPEYDFQHCLRESLVKKIGCKLTWDSWTSDDFPVCSELKDLRMYHIEYATIADMELNEILNYAGCSKPCRYKEYKIVGKEKLHGKAYLFLDFAKNEVVIEKEMKSYSGLSLLADIGGSLGLFLGFSFLMVWDGVEIVFLRIRQVWWGRADTLK